MFSAFMVFYGRAKLAWNCAMTVKNELKDVVLEVLALLIAGCVVILLMIYTDLGKWPAILIGVGFGVGVVMLIRSRRKN